MNSPALRPCRGCTSLYCGPYRCRFEEHQQPATLEEQAAQHGFMVYRRLREQGVTAEKLASESLFGSERGEAFERQYQDIVHHYADAMIRRDKVEPEWLREARTGDPR